MPCLMVAQVLFAANAKPDFMNVKPDGITVGKGEYRFVVIGSVVEVEYLLGNRMERDECLHLRLLSVLCGQSDRRSIGCGYSVCRRK